MQNTGRRCVAKGYERDLASPRRQVADAGDGHSQHRLRRGGLECAAWDLSTMYFSESGWRLFFLPVLLPPPPPPAARHYNCTCFSPSPLLGQQRLKVTPPTESRIHTRHTCSSITAYQVSSILSTTVPLPHKHSLGAVLDPLVHVIHIHVAHDGISHVVMRVGGGDGTTATWITRPRTCSIMFSYHMRR